MKSHLLPCWSDVLIISLALSTLFQLLCMGAVFGQSRVKIVAGGGSCDGGRATDAGLNSPYFALPLPNNDTLIVDSYNGRIRKIDKNGITSTIAGTGLSSWNGDGIEATSANLFFPYSVAVNSLQEIIVADSDHARIRKIFTNGTITTIAGNGLTSYNGDGIDAKSTQLKPTFLIVDSNDNIYFSDSNNNRVRKIFTNGTIVTIAGNGNNLYNGQPILATDASLSSPKGLALSPEGELYIALYFDNRIAKLLKNGTLVSIVGTGTNSFASQGIATNTPLSFPEGLSLAPNGELYIAEFGKHCIKKLLTNGTIITIAGTGTLGYNGDNMGATTALLNNPKSAILDSNGDLIIADTGNNRVRKVSSGIITTFAGTGSKYCLGNKTPLNANTNNAKGIAIMSNDEYYFSDGTVIYKIANDTISYFAGTPASNGFYGDGMNALNAKLNYVSGIFIDSNSEMYIADMFNNRIRKIFTNGTITTIAGNGQSTYNGEYIDAKSAAIYYPNFVTVDSLGQVYISDASNRIRKILTNGTIITIVGDGVASYGGDNILAKKAHVNSPSGIAVNSLGEIFIADTNNNRIRKILTNGTIITIAGNGQTTYNGEGIDAKDAKLNYPTGIALSPNGDVYFSEQYGNRIRKIYSNGTIVTVVGPPTLVYNDNNVNLSTTVLNNPFDVKMKPNGEILISDSNNFKIRLITFQCNNSLSSDPDVCNGNGICVGNEQCYCNSKFEGTYCQNQRQFNCFGISSFNSSFVCSGNGECIDEDNCKCNDGWIGDCSIPICFEIPANNYSQVCSGHGNCSNINNCTCEIGWNGSNCSIQIISNNEMNSTNSTDTFNGTALNNSTINNETFTSNAINNITNIDNSTVISNNQLNSTNTTGTWNETVNNNSSINNQTFNSNITNNNITVIDNSTVSNSSIDLNTTISNNTISNNTINNSSTLMNGNNTVIDNSTVSNYTSANNSNTNMTTINNLSNNTVSNNTMNNSSTPFYGNNSVIDNSTFSNYTNISNNTTINNSTNQEVNEIISNGNSTKIVPLTNNDNYYAFFTLLIIPIVIVVLLIPIIYLIMRKMKRGKDKSKETNVELPSMDVAHGI